MDNLKLALNSSSHHATPLVSHEATPLLPCADTIQPWSASALAPKQSRRCQATPEPGLHRPDPCFNPSFDPCFDPLLGASLMDPLPTPGGPPDTTGHAKKNPGKIREKIRKKIQ